MRQFFTIVFSNLQGFIKKTLGTLFASVKSINKNLEGELMIKKALMIALYLSIGFQAIAAVNINMTSREPASLKKDVSKNICMIQSGDIGKLKYKGTSMSDAFTKVTDECFQKRNQLFVKSRKQEASQDRQIQFAESCANSVKCI